MSTSIPPQLPRRLRNFLGTNPVEDVRGTGATHRAVAPFTGEESFSFPIATPEDVTAAVRDARSTVGRGDRSAILLQLHDLIRQHEDLILDLIQFENGKSRAHAYDELMDLYNCALYYGRNVKKAFSPQRHRGALPVLTQTRTQYYPVGVVGLISPWNYPLSLGVGDVLAALSAGNAVVHKPDSQTVLTAIFVRRLAIEAGLESSAWQLVPGHGREVGDSLIPQVDAVSFTGSTAAGKKIAAQAAERLLPTMLELGGKNPMLVLDDAPLKHTAEGAVRTAFSSSGQLCMSAERLYIREDRVRSFLLELTAALDAQKMGAAFSDEASIGSLTSAEQLATVQRPSTTPSPRAPSWCTAGSTGRTSDRSSLSRRCSPTSPRTWSATPTRPSARCSPCTGCSRRKRPSSWPMRPTTASARLCGPPTPSTPGRWRRSWRPAW